MNKNIILKALSWNIIGTFGNQATLFVIGIILARLLKPEDFGIISMVLVFSSFGQILIDLGFNNAIIQKRTNTQTDLSTIFYLNLIIALILFIILFLSSNAIAYFYNENKLINVTKVMSVIFVVYSFSSVQRTLIIKKLDFKSEGIIIMISSITSGGISIVLALKGYGVWALVLKIVLQKFFETILFWLKSQWYPSLVFKVKSIKKYLNFSLNITAASLINGITQNIDRLIVGKVFSAEILGFFDRSKKYNALFRSNIANILGKVMFPVFSEIQDDNEKFINIYRKTVKMICFFTVPFFLILVLIAKSLIIVLITDKWISSVILLQILAVSGFTYPVSMIMVKAIVAKGRADIFFKLDVIKTMLYVFSILIGIYWGIIGVASAITLVNFIGLAINSLAISKLIKFRMQNQVRDVSTIFLISITMSSILIIIKIIIVMNNFQTLIILPIAGIIIYALANYIFSHKQIEEIKSLFARIIKKANI